MSTLDLVADEIDQLPDQETIDLYQAIRSGQIKPEHKEPIISGPLITEEKENLTPGGIRASNIPVIPTPFIGRSSELAEIARLLSDPACRMLTITGFGGAGKTRLALQVASELSAAYTHGVSFVPLAPLSSPDLIVPALASSLNFTYYGQQDNKQPLLNYLAGKDMLLVMDNFEHLLGGARLLSEILETAPRVKILVTSRERLNLSMEWVMTLQGMLFPEQEMVSELEKFSAVQLFITSARRARVDFTLTSEDYPVLARICRLVEGLPLGIELAASWVRTLSLIEIASEIENNLDFLSTPLQDVPERHQSMRAVFERSWLLLEENEKRVFRKLSVFRGGFSRQAAQAVVGATIQVLTSLVDRSLVYSIPGGRYELHELVRQYTLEKLQQDLEEEEQTRWDHCTYYLDFLTSRHQDLRGKRQKGAFAEITRDLDNIRTAWAWGVMNGQLDLISRSARELMVFYDYASRPQEGEELLRYAVEGFKVDPQIITGTDREASLQYSYLLNNYTYLCIRSNRMHSFKEIMEIASTIFQRWEDRYGLALLAMTEGTMALREEFPEMESKLRESVVILKNAGDLHNTTICLLILCDILRGLGKVQEARERYLESLAICRSTGNRSGESTVLHDLGNLAEYVVDFAEAKGYYSQAIPIAREMGNIWSTAINLDSLGYVCRLLGEFENAETYHRESLELSRETGDQLGIAGSLDNLGLVAYDLGDYLIAAQLIQEGLQIRRQVGRQWDIAVSLENLAGIYLTQGKVDDAQQLLDEALPIRRWLGYGEGLSRCLSRLGWAQLIRNELEQARDYFRESIQQAVSVHARSYILTGIVGFASTLQKTHQAEQAVTWLSFALEQPNLMPEDRKLALETSKALEETLPKDNLARARQISQSLAFEEIVSTLLSQQISNI
jgi:predicted ATPase